MQKRGTVLVHCTSHIIEIHLPVKFLIVFMLCSSLNICKFSKTNRPTEAKFYMAPPWDRWKAHSNDLGLFLLLIIVYPRGRCIQQGFHHKFGPAMQGFQQGFETEKIKAPLFPGPRGGGDTDDWCIIYPIYFSKVRILSILDIINYCKFGNFSKVLFSRNFVYAKFRENEILAKL